MTTPASKGDTPWLFYMSASTLIALMFSTVIAPWVGYLLVALAALTFFCALGVIKTGLLKRGVFGLTLWILLGVSGGAMGLQGIGQIMFPEDHKKLAECVSRALTETSVTQCHQQYKKDTLGRIPTAPQ